MRFVPPLIAFGFVAGVAVAGEPVPGPVPADVLSVYDGDTMTVRAHVWPDLAMTVSVRVDGVDTPEIAGACSAEKSAAVRARDFVRGVAGDRVFLLDVHHGKYAGRVVARVRLADGRDLADVLIAEGYGRAYDGGRRDSWCP